MLNILFIYLKKSLAYLVDVENKSTAIADNRVAVKLEIETKIVNIVTTSM